MTDHSTEQDIKHTPSPHVALAKVFPSHSTLQATGNCPHLLGQGVQGAHLLKEGRGQTPQWNGQSNQQQQKQQTKDTACYHSLPHIYPRKASTCWAQHTARTLDETKRFHYKMQMNAEMKDHGHRLAFWADLNEELTCTASLSH